jgi:hypothetical protein
MKPNATLRMLRSPSAATLALTSLSAALLSAQESFVECTRVVHTTIRQSTGEGRALAVVPDVNGDGASELLLGSAGLHFLRVPGRVVLIDGRSGAELLRIDGALDDRLGYAVAAAGDFDGDGLGDLLVGAPGLGVARVYSSTGGALLLEVAGLAGAFGRAVAGLGDLDGDALPDLAVSELDELSIGGVRGRVSIFSGADGHLLRSLTAPGADDRFGYELERMGDVTSDERSELAVLARTATDPGRGFGRVTVLDPLSGLEVFALSPEPGDEYRSLAWMRNVGGDPRVDRPGIAIIGARNDVPPLDLLDRGLVEIVSADTGVLVRRYLGRTGEFYEPAAAAGDLNGDRFDDLLLGGRLGSTLAVSGFNGSTLRQLDYLGGPVGALAALADVDGDRRAEIVLATNDFWDGVDWRNRVLVVSGSAPVETFGVGHPGSESIVPQIGVRGCPRLRGSLHVETERVLGGAPGMLVLGAARVDQPFRGGTLYPRRDFLIGHRAGGVRSVAGVGDASLALTMPIDPALAGREFYAQAAYLDPGALQGVALTPALKLTLY